MGSSVGKNLKYMIYIQGKNPNSRNGFKKGHSMGFRKGYIPWNKGTRKLYIKKGYHSWNKGLKGLPGYWKGKKKYPMSEDTKRKIGIVNSIKLKGRKLSETTKKKMSLSRIGNKNWNWKGGISFEPYSLDWTMTLKRSIRERDKYTCQICGKQQEDRAFDVHHIDYNKQNCNPNNLITLCHKCHLATNINRDYWKKDLIQFIRQQERL